MRPVATWISTLAVVIIVALALPVSQLRLVGPQPTCCCPDPKNCHCFDRVHDTHDQDSLRECHGEPHPAVATDAPAIVPVLTLLAAVRAAAPAPHDALPQPHEPPVPERPPAPS